DIFLLPPLQEVSVDLFRILTASHASDATFGSGLLSCRTRVPIVMSARPSVWSSTGFCLPFDPAQVVQFFQKPIVRARPPGKVLSIVNTLVSPGETVKLVQTVLLSPPGLKTVKKGGPRVVMKPGM